LVDERRDPISSTRAAARFSTRVHDMLDTWPLTITAYNHGPDGVARAVSEVGTNDIATIVRDYHGKAFGFASRNFYVEFLAALEVERDHRTYFGDLHGEPPPRVRERHALPAPGARRPAAEGAPPSARAHLPRARARRRRAHRGEAQRARPQPRPREEGQAPPPPDPPGPERARGVARAPPQPRSR